METETLNLKIRKVIGTGDPFDVIMLIPLRHDWGVPPDCIMNLTEPCDEKIRRLYVLDEPVDGHSVVGICEKHHLVFAEHTKGDTDDAQG